MKKVILKLDLQDDKAKQKALKTVSTLSGIDSISMDMNEKKLTVIGSVDPVNVVRKLRKYWPADIISVGPAEEPKKEEPKKEDEKKEDGKKEGEEAKKEGEEKKDEAKKEGEGGEEAKKEEAKTEDEKKADEEKKKETYKAYNPHMTTYYYVQSMEENPNACVIC